MTAEERDEALGASVRELGTPPPGADFFPRLAARLQQEAESMAEERARRRWRTTSLLGAAAAVTVIAMVASWVGVPGIGPGPRPAAAVTVEELKMIVATSVAQATSVQGELALVETNVTAEERRWSFALSGAGDFRLTALDRREDLSYNAGTGVQRAYTVTPTGRVIATETTGLAAGPPDPAAEVSVLGRSLGSAVRAFLAAQTDVPVVEETYEDRPAWTFRASLDRRGPRTLDDLDVVVDRETGFPLRIRTVEGPADRPFVRDVRMSKLTVNAHVPADRFLLTFPPETPPVVSLDKGFRRVTLTEVAGGAGYEPLLPSRLPDGFELKEVAVARSGDRLGGAGNPVSRDVVSIGFHRGFDRATVATRATGDDPRRWTDPLAGNQPGETEQVTVATGSFAGATAEIVTGLTTVPHIWAVNDRLVVTVTGDLSRDELIVALESL